MTATKPAIAVSGCLLGERVRYDGEHKHESVVTGELAASLRLVPLCPEVEIGLGVPRPPIRLVRVEDAIRLREVDGERDLTDRMEDWAATRLAALHEQGICGFVLKARSPSCGLGTATVHEVVGSEVGLASGLFARMVELSSAHLPVVDEEALRDPEARERFVAAVREAHRLRAVEEGETP